MNEYELIDTAREGLNNAERLINEDNHQGYAEYINIVLDLLIEELVGEPPETKPGAPGAFNPERVLEEIAIAIKHRTLSNTHRWKIIYYHERITCVPTTVTVPDRIVLHEFTEQMTVKGFSITYWNQLKQNVIKLYKEFIE